LLKLLQAVAKGPSIHAAWQASDLAISFRSACRWLVKWRGLKIHVRPRLHQMVSPPGKTDEMPDPLMLRHLEAAFPLAPCPMAAFQSEFQTSIAG
jgi:hypothetical protein